MNKKQTYNTIAIISTIGIICWMITDFFGGMVIYFFSYGLIIIPIIILYIISFFDTLISTIKRGITHNLLKVVFHGLVLTAIFFINLFQSDLLKSKRVLTATLKDDQFFYTLIFRKNGNCENEVSGMFGFQEVFHGKYRFKRDKLYLQKSHMTITSFQTLY